LIGAAAACCASACAGVPHRLEPATVASARATDVTSLIPQQHATVLWVASGYGMNGNSGLIGAIVAASANKGRRERAEEHALPLRWQTQDIDFQSRYTEALTAVLKDVPFLRFQRLTRYDANLPSVRAEEVERGNVLRVGTDYYLSPDSVVLVVASGFGFFASGQPDRAAAVMRTFYRSEEIGHVEDEPAIALWTAAGASRYRGALAEGAAENLKMTRMALAYMSGTDYAGPKVRIHALINHARGDFGVKPSATYLEGTIVEESAHRIILQTEDAFYSIPRSAIDEREDRGRSPGIAWQPPPNPLRLVFAAPPTLPPAGVAFMPPPASPPPTVAAPLPTPVVAGPQAGPP
jgi:hypothetical protein